MSNYQRVLISGAGPVGLYAALKLASEGVPVTVFESESTLCEEYRAAGWHGPTLDMFEDLDVLDDVRGKGLSSDVMHLTDRATGAKLAMDMSLLKGEVRNSYVVACSQPNVVRILRDALLQYSSAECLMNHRVVAVSQNENGVSVTVDAEGDEKYFTGAWLIGADGSRSIVRKAIGAVFDGFTWKDRFLIMETDYEETNFLDHYEANNFVADAEEWRFIMTLPNDDGSRRWRVCCAVPEGVSSEEAVSDEYIQNRFQAVVPREEKYNINERRVYSVHQRTASCYRKGRMMIAGDAAHLNNPLGGQGANSGIHDADNLCEKLMKVMRGERGEELLDLYDRQRRLTNVNVIQPSTIANKKRLDETNPIKRKLNALMWFLASKSKVVQRKILRNSSMIDSLRYAASVK